MQCSAVQYSGRVKGQKEKVGSRSKQNLEQGNRAASERVRWERKDARDYFRVR
jgi:hypothetical protein